MRSLILACPTDSLVDLLDERDVPFVPCQELIDVSDAILADPDAVLAYCEPLLGFICTRQVRAFPLKPGNTALMLVEDMSVYEESDSMVWQAAGNLDLSAIIDVSYQEATDRVKDLLAGTWLIPRSG